MLSAARRRLAVLASVLLVGLVAAGCGAVREQTQWQADRTHGVSATAGDIGIRNALVVADDDGRRATVIAMFDNARGEADELVSIRVGGRDAEPEGGPMEIPAGGNVSVGPDHTRVDVTGADAQPGRRVELEFIFANAPRATVNALVLSADGIYADTLD